MEDFKAKGYHSKSEMRRKEAMKNKDAKLIEEMRVAEKKATPGPWKIDPLEGKYYGTKIVASEGGGNLTLWAFGDIFHEGYTASEREKEKGWDPKEEGYDHVEMEQDYEDAHFIALARTAVPALIDLVERLTYERDQLLDRVLDLENAPVWGGKQ